MALMPLQSPLGQAALPRFLLSFPPAVAVLAVRAEPVLCLCRAGGRSPWAAPRAAPGQGGGGAGSEGVPAEPPAPEGSGPVLPWLVWHREELCGSDGGQSPVPGWAEERLCQGVRVPPALPTSQLRGLLQGKANNKGWSGTLGWAGVHVLPSSPCGALAWV